VGSCRRDLLDHVIVLNEGHLKRLLREYVRYYHKDRTHLGLAKDTPDGRPVASDSAHRNGFQSFARLGLAYIIVTPWRHMREILRTSKLWHGNRLPTRSPFALSRACASPLYLRKPLECGTYNFGTPYTYDYVGDQRFIFPRGRF